MVLHNWVIGLITRLHVIIAENNGRYGTAKILTHCGRMTQSSFLNHARFPRTIHLITQKLLANLF
jgi:hypothetical protein